MGRSVGKRCDPRHKTQGADVAESRRPAVQARPFTLKSSRPAVVLASVKGTAYRARGNRRKPPPWRCRMDKFVACLNIKHLGNQIAEEHDPAKRAVLCRILAEEEAKLVAILAREVHARTA